MAEKERPEWWPDWDADRVGELGRWTAGVEAGVKAVIERIETINTMPDWSDSWVMIMREEWEQLRKEAGLDD